MTERIEQRRGCPRLGTLCRRLSYPVLMLAAANALAQQGESGVMTIEGAQIRGDQELPTVMYLVPWQPPEVQALDRADEKLMVGTSIAPLERAEFQRLVNYHRHFQLQTGSGVPGKSPEASASETP